MATESSPFTLLDAFSSSGRATIRYYTGDVLGSEQYELGNSPSLQATFEDYDVTSVKSRDTGTYNQNLATFTTPGSFGATLTLDTFSADAKKLSFLASSAALTQTAGADAVLSVTLVKDAWISTGKLNISDVTIAGLVEGTDFIVKSAPGLIMALTAGAAGAKTGTFDYAEITNGVTLSAGANSSGVRCAVTFYGVNRASGNDIIMEFGDCILTPTSGFDFNNPEPQTVEYDMAAKIPAGKSGVFEYHEF
jgi:hypothetical protein